MTAGDTSSLIFCLASWEAVSARIRLAMLRTLSLSSWRKTTTSSNLFSISGRKYAYIKRSAQKLSNLSKDQTNMQHTTDACTNTIESVMLAYTSSQLLSYEQTWQSLEADVLCLVYGTAFTG